MGARRHLRALNYYGSKAAAASRYPRPLFPRIFEPFCGGAGYALRYRHFGVVLMDKNPDVVGAWRFLIRAQPSDVLALPLLEPGEEVPSGIDEGARLLIGFSVMMYGARPQSRMTPCAARVPASFWGERRRAAMAALAGQIKHWSVTCGDYAEMPNEIGTWFIDPPYAGVAGSHYEHHSGLIDYAALGAWCRSRSGQAIVCESPDATWLPFAEHHEHASAPTADVVGRRRSREGMWTNGR
jgi:hypothetical protein